MNKFVLILVTLAVTFSMGAERYKDRLFEVSKEKNVVYASGVLHLKKLNSIV